MKQPPNIQIEPDWEELSLPFHMGSGRSLYSGLEQEQRLRLRMFRRRSDHHLIAHAWFGEGADGPPGHVHGGALAYVLDEAMGCAAWMNNYPVVAAKLEFEYKQMTPLFSDLRIEAWISAVEKRRVRTEAIVSLPTGETCVIGRGAFAILNRSKIRMIAPHALELTGELGSPELKWSDDDAS